MALGESREVGPLNLRTEIEGAVAGLQQAGAASFDKVGRANQSEGGV